MKISVLVAGSLFGMIGSSAAVGWWMGPAPVVQDAAGDTIERRDRETPPAVGVPQTPRGPEPTFVTDGSLRLEGRLGHPVLPAGRSQDTFVLLQVAAPDDEGIESRAPVNVGIVLDKSGSMKGQRMTNALAAVRGMVAQLRPDDIVSLVAYDRRAEVLIPPTPARRLDAFELSRMLANVRGGGATCISCGIEMSRAMLRRHDGAVNRILLLSDGQANFGITDPSGFRAIGDDTRRDRAAIASIGVDIDYDERTMLALSEASNGRHYFVRNPSELGEVFEQERRALVGSVADRVDVDIALAEGVQLLEVVDRPHRRDGDRVSVSLGSFATGEEKTVLLRVRVDGRVGDQRIADVDLVWRDLVDEAERRSAGALGLRLDPTLASAGEIDPLVETRLGRKDTFDALITANAAFSAGDVAKAQRELDRARHTVAKRKSTAAKSGGSVKLEADFERQLNALDNARSSFDEAARKAPPAAAPQSVQGRTATRANAAAADPFSD